MYEIKELSWEKQGNNYTCEVAGYLIFEENDKVGMRVGSWLEYVGSVEEAKDRFREMYRGALLPKLNPVTCVWLLAHVDTVFDVTRNLGFIASKPTVEELTNILESKRYKLTIGQVQELLELQRTCVTPICELTLKRVEAL